jgi:hypothetical protein
MDYMEKQKNQFPLPGVESQFLSIWHVVYCCTGIAVLAQEAMQLMHQLFWNGAAIVLQGFSNVHAYEKQALESPLTQDRKGFYSCGISWR